MSTKKSWYLRCSSDDVGPNAVLVGDRGRVALAAEMMSNSVMHNEDRGLTTATGSYNGQKVTVSAFGMGAPIATVVLHELASLGVKRVLRLGTVLTAADTQLGELVVAHGAIRGEASATSYLPIEYPAVPDFGLTRDVERAAAASSRPWRAGIFATYDGFYTEMMLPTLEQQAELQARLSRQHVVASDMETSAVLVVGRALGVAAASLCLASVDGHTFDKIDGEDRRIAEQDLLRVGLDALTLPQA